MIKIVAGRAALNVLTLALIIPVAVVCPASAQLAPSASPNLNQAPWSRTSMPWTLLPSGDSLGPLPGAINVPPVPFQYAAKSERIDLFGKNQPAIIRLTLRVQSGNVGLLLVTPDGSARLSGEASLQPSADDAEVYFRVRPATQPSMIVMRNYDAQGVVGLVELKSVEFIREGDLGTEELSAIIQKGLY